jgi:hypothetical protein
VRETRLKSGSELQNGGSVLRKLRAPGTYLLTHVFWPIAGGPQAWLVLGQLGRGGPTMKAKGKEGVQVLIGLLLILGGLLSTRHGCSQDKVTFRAPWRLGSKVALAA